MGFTLEFCTQCKQRGMSGSHEGVFLSNQRFVHLQEGRGVREVREGGEYMQHDELERSVYSVCM